MDDHTLIRRATPDDAKACAPLILETGPEMFAHMLGAGRRRLVQVLAEVFVVPDHAFSYQHAFVAERDGAVIGCMIAYPGFQSLWLSMRLSAVFLRVLALRELARSAWRAVDFFGLEPGIKGRDYYVQSLAVVEAARGQGVGWQMLAWAEEQGRQARCTQLAIDVVEENPRARSLYEKFGFRLVRTKAARRRLRKATGISASHRMVKAL